MQHLKFLPLILLLIAGIAFLIRGPDNSTKTNEFVREFKSAYAAEAEISGNVKEFTINALPGEIELINDVSTTIWSYNDSVPGPELRVTKGDTVRVRFHNQLPQATTIHWHGVRVPNEMDGVPGVTQDAIEPGETYVYEFTPKDAGTFWYHPHVRGSEQVERGLYGTLVVEDPDDPAYDIDQTIVVDDWRLLEDGQVDPRFNTGHDMMHDGRWGSTVTVNGITDFSISASPGQRIRLRFVNTSNGRVYKLGFGGLEAQVIAVDGMKSGKTFSADTFELAPGNRLDVDIHIPASVTGKTFRISDSFTRKTANLFQINVDGETVTDNDFPVPTATHMPMWEDAAAADITKEYILNARRGGPYGIEWTLNGEAYPNAQPITLSAGEFNKVRFTNDSSRLHPMHLHGQFFKVVARDGRKVDEPYWRDTVLVHAKETVDIALVPLDKGKWATHCHILEHAEAGMMTVIHVE